MRAAAWRGARKLRRALSGLGARAGARAGAVFLAALIAPPAFAAEDITSGLNTLQQRDELVQSIGWKLITGNSPFCPDTRPAIGLLLQDVAAFGRPDAVRRAMNLSGDIAVQARAAGSPVEQAGLPVFAEVLAIEGQSMRDLPPAGKERWQRLAELHRTVDTALVARGEVEIVWRREQGAPIVSALVGRTACTTNFEVIARSRRVSANGARVAIGSDFAGFTYREESLAAAIAHELAHNLLGHPAWLDANGRSQSHIRMTEREADRLMPWLLANGGYDPEAGERFMREWGPGNDGGLFRGRTHDGWNERAALIAAELPLIQRSTAASGGADWASGFIRDIPPAAYSAAASSSPIE